MKTFALMMLCLLMAGCATTGKKVEGVFSFSGKPADDCEFLGYIESEATKGTEADNYDEARYGIMKQAEHYHANAVKFMSVNRIVSKISISAEAYKCPNLLQMKVTDESHLSFDAP